MAQRLDACSLLEKVRRLQIQGRSAAAEVLAGMYKSAFRGPGLAFQEIREYQPGDESRSIDWNVTARRGRLHVKTFHEERAQTILLVLDGSASLRFGSGTRSKLEAAAELCALLIFSALSNRDCIGLLLFAERTESLIAPRRGLEHGLRLIREILVFDPRWKGTSLATALETVMKVQRRRAIVFLISDFLDSGYEPLLKRTALQHDLVAVRIRDPRERELPKGTLARLVDLETGARGELDLGDKRFRDAHAQAMRETDAGRRREFAAMGVDFLEMETDADCASLLRSFFEIRMQRRAHR